MKLAAALLLTVALALAGQAGRAQTATQPAATPGEATDKPGPWTTGTAPAQAPTPSADASALALRIYSSQGRREQEQQGLPPYAAGSRHRDDSAYAVDVSAVISRCADGRQIITALVIGGQVTPLDNRCPNEPAPAPRCDAKNWNCSPAPAK